MKARVLILVACISLFAAAALAHGGEEHVIGTVAKISQDSITVKTTTPNKMVTVAVVPESKFIKRKAAAKIPDLKVGDRIVIHAKEITEGNLVADTVEFAAAEPATIPVQTSQGQSKAQMLTGVVSDSSCGAIHMMKNMSAADCAHVCVKTGQKYALVIGKDVYVLHGHEAELDKLTAQTVTVKAALSGNVVTVESVAPMRKG